MDGGARHYAPRMAHNAGFVKHRKRKKHNSYSILVMQRSEHESMCATETGTYAHYEVNKSTT